MSGYPTRPSTSVHTLLPCPPIENWSYRVSWAVTASRMLRQLLSHSALLLSWKRTVYRSIILSILTYAMDGALLSPAQLTKLNSVHFKSLRRISKFFIGFWSPLLMADLTFSTRKIPTPSQLHSQQRLQLLGPRSLIQTLRIS